MIRCWIWNWCSALTVYKLMTARRDHAVRRFLKKSLFGYLCLLAELANNGCLAELLSDSANDLIGFVPLSCQKENVPRTRFANGRLDGLGSIPYDTIGLFAVNADT